jgi:hypothetical protein
MKTPWFKKATVQAALIAGLFTLLVAILHLFKTEENKNLYQQASPGSIQAGRDVNIGRDLNVNQRPFFSDTQFVSQGGRLNLANLATLNLISISADGTKLTFVLDPDSREIISPDSDEDQQKTEESIEEGEKGQVLHAEPGKYSVRFSERLSLLKFGSDQRYEFDTDKNRRNEIRVRDRIFIVTLIHSRKIGDSPIEYEFGISES